MKYIIVIAVLLAAGCAQRTPISVTPILNCPQPAALALTPAPPLPPISALSGEDPSAVIGILSEALAQDSRAYGDEAVKREILIDHGVRLCGWTR